MGVFSGPSTDSAAFSAVISAKFAIKINAKRIFLNTKMAFVLKSNLCEISTFRIYFFVCVYECFRNECKQMKAFLYHKV